MCNQKHNLTNKATTINLRWDFGCKRQVSGVAVVRFVQDTVEPLLPLRKLNPEYAATPTLLETQFSIKTSQKDSSLYI